MTIPFEEIAARLLADPKVKAEYDALAAEFENSAESQGHSEKEPFPQGSQDAHPDAFDSLRTCARP